MEYQKSTSMQMALPDIFRISSVNSDDTERIKQHPARFVILIPHDFVKGSFMCPWKLLVNTSFEQLSDSFVL